jgi:hypothetical protein
LDRLTGRLALIAADRNISSDFAAGRCRPT